MFKKNNSDIITWCVIFILLSSSLYFFYFFSSYSFITRILPVILSLAIGVILFSYTYVGNYCWSFIKTSFKEIYIITWPSKKETLQTTLVISGLVILMGMILCLIDLVFFNLIKWVANFG